MNSIDEFKPLHGRIVVEREEEQDRIGSIILPEQSRERPHRGRVLKCAKQVEWVRPGDWIRFSAKGRPEVKIGDAFYNIIVEQDIYGVEDDAALYIAE